MAQSRAGGAAGGCWGTGSAGDEGWEGGGVSV